MAKFRGPRRTLEIVNEDYVDLAQREGYVPKEEQIRRYEMAGKALDNYLNDMYSGDTVNPDGSPTENESYIADERYMDKPELEQAYKDAVSTAKRNSKVTQKTKEEEKPPEKPPEVANPPA